MVKINTAEFRKQLNSTPTKTSVFISDQDLFPANHLGWGSNPVQMEVFPMFVWNLSENIIFRLSGHRRGNRGGIQDVWPRQLRLHQPQRGEVSNWEGEGEGEARKVLILATFRHVVTKLNLKISDDQINDMMKIADRDGDGEVNYSEFIRLIRR